MKSWDDGMGLQTRLKLGTFLSYYFIHSTDYYLLFTDYATHAD